uniref:Uncharacterized protein n=1 Tax=Wuchereria bancrofti TaxID=6293 RepID=A0A1I8ELV3_WUCBA
MISAYNFRTFYYYSFIRKLEMSTVFTATSFIIYVSPNSKSLTNHKCNGVKKQWNIIFTKFILYCDRLSHCRSNDIKSLQNSVRNVETIPIDNSLADAEIIKGEDLV